MDAQPDIARNQAVEAISPASGRTSNRPGKGLLSHWHPGNLQPPNLIGDQDKASLADQDTFKQKTIDRPITGPQLYSNKAYTQGLANGSGQVSPHDSGISSPMAMPPNSNSAWPWGQPQAAQRPGLQTLAPPPQPVVQAQMRPASSPLSLPEMPMPMSPVPPENYGGPPGKQPRGTNKRRRKRRFPIWARVVAAALLVILVLIGGIASYLYSTFSAPVGNIVNQQVQRAKGEEDPNASRNGADILSGPRINILLLGSDTDQKFTNADGTHTYLAQTDIVVTIDPATKSVGMLSIPRDFYINVPGYGMHKLDEAYALGGPVVGSGAYSPGGVELSRLTIEKAFGISINYYAWVGLDGFVKVIDTVGGVDVDVAHPIVDDNYPDDVGNHTGFIYGAKRLYILPGPQHLDGLSALEYVRSRHGDLVGDFGRSARQQQVLSALKTKLDNPDIVGKLPAIANDLNGYVKTDMQLTDVFKLMNFARSLDPNKINKVILDPPYSSSATLPGGESVVNPNCEKIVPVIAKMFDLGSKAACNIQGDSSNNTSIASTSPASSPLVSTVANIGLQSADQMASTGVISLTGGNGGKDLFGVHSLLDLLLMTVFESPQAMQV